MKKAILFLSFMLIVLSNYAQTTILKIDAVECQSIKTTSIDDGCLLYEGIIMQYGTNAPTMYQTYKNTLGVTVDWFTYQGVGQYYITDPVTGQILKKEKTFVLFSPMSTTGRTAGYCDGDEVMSGIIIFTRNLNNEFANGWLSAYILIKVYP